MIFKSSEIGEVEVNRSFIYAATVDGDVDTLTDWDNIDSSLKDELEAIAEDITKKAERIKAIAFGLSSKDAYDCLPASSNGEQVRPL